MTTVAEKPPATDESPVTEEQRVRAVRRRNRLKVLGWRIAGYVFERNREDAAAGRARPIASEHDAYGVVGAVVELASRQIRTGVPENIADLEPVILRLFRGLLAASPPEGQPAAT